MDFLVRAKQTSNFGFFSKGVPFMKECLKVAEKKGMPIVRRLHRHLAALILATTNGIAIADSEPVTFAVIGDYGDDNANEAAVASLIANVLQPDFVVTVGDNNYGSHSAAGYDAAIGG
jgi:hypothetical protein